MKKLEKRNNIFLKIINLTIKSTKLTGTIMGVEMMMKISTPIIVPVSFVDFIVKFIIFKKIFFKFFEILNWHLILLFLIIY